MVYGRPYFLSYALLCLVFIGAVTSTLNELPTAPNISLVKLQLTCSLASATFFSSSEPSTLDLEEILVVVDKTQQLSLKKIKFTIRPKNCAVVERRRKSRDPIP